MAAKKMLDLAKSGGPVVTDPNSASFPDDDDEEEEIQPAPPVLREYNPNKPASLTADMNSARLPSAKRRMASEYTTHASASKPYHLTILDPATTKLEDVYKEWNEGLSS
jgi:hypothetical protein